MTKRMASSNIDYKMTLDSLVETLEDIAAWHNLDLGHGERTALTAVSIGKKLDLNDEELKLLDYAARIHDIGRVAIDDEIIAKTGNLTTSQRAAMEAHPVIGYRFLYRSNLPKEITETILHHHEHFDGSGYPTGLSGYDIPLFSRIVTIADIWDALISERPYRSAMTFEKALGEMNKMLNYFDPKLYTIFLSVIK